MDLSAVSRERCYRYRLLQRPQGVVERNRAIGSGPPGSSKSLAKLA